MIISFAHLPSMGLVVASCCKPLSLQFWDIGTGTIADVSQWSEETGRMSLQPFHVHNVTQALTNLSFDRHRR